MQSLYTAVTGVQAQDQRITAISNNLANANTTGYKSQRVNFADLFYRQVKPVGMSAQGDNRVPNGIQLGTGVRTVSTARNFGDGALEKTERPFDIAIQNGHGFFQVRLRDNETGYTRDGSFTLNEDGLIVDSNGNILEPEITINPQATDISISPDGEVTGLLPEQTERAIFGEIELAAFVNPAGLMAIGDNLFLETEVSGEAVVGAPAEDGRGQLVQRALESSNVELVREMVDMIQTQRAYEINSQVIQTSNEMMQTIGQLRR
jgi:flagellar basal-body rod protein FlgG